MSHDHKTSKLCKIILVPQGKTVQQLTNVAGHSYKLARHFVNERAVADPLTLNSSSSLSSKIRQATNMDRAERLYRLKENIRHSTDYSPGGWLTIAREKHTRKLVRAKLNDEEILQLAYAVTEAEAGSTPSTPTWGKLDLHGHFAKLGGERRGETTKRFFTEAIVALNIEHHNHSAAPDTGSTPDRQSDVTDESGELVCAEPNMTLSAGSRVLMPGIVLLTGVIAMLYFQPDASIVANWIPIGRFRISNATRFINEVVTTHEEALEFARGFFLG